MKGFKRMSFIQQLNNIKQVTRNQRKIYSDLSSKLSQLIKDLQNCISLKVGQQFQPISNYKRWGSEEFTKIEHIPGQILILYYWSVENNDFVSNITSFKQMFGDLFENWGKNVRFIALSLSLQDESEEAMEYVKDSIDYIDFYFPKSREQSDIFLYSAFQANFLVVDKLGKIRKYERDKAHLSEGYIQSLIDEQKIQKQKEIMNITSDQVDRVLEILQSPEVQQKLNQESKPKMFKFYLQIDQVQTDRRLKFEYFDHPLISYQCKDFQLEFINQILKSIFELIPENIWCFCEKKVLQTFSVPYPGSICSLCNKDILNEAQLYYSPFKKVHLCVECAEFDDKTKKGAERYKCTDNLVFINGPFSDLSVLENIDQIMIGKNLQLQEGEKGNQSHSIWCFGCSYGCKGPRYISTSARYDGYIKDIQKIFYFRVSIIFVKNASQKQKTNNKKNFINTMIYL